MTISIKYHLIKRKDGAERKLPYIPIELHGEKGTLWVETYALLDSGADISVIPKDFAELIGVKMDGKPTIANGLGGEVNVVNSRMNVKMKGDRTTYEFNIPVQVILDESKIPVLLGRDGFFSYFRIEFDHNNERIRLIKNNVVDFDFKNK
ncbi:MAG: retropepsin-like aspartic protease [Candidatus Pacearchaeota archaeon]|nr:retropepsin-like aspartic protease [Candidatus Pacearchaeota archaeon]